jgi:hypothetical protein
MTDGIDSMHNALSLPLICGSKSALTESVGEMVSEGFYVNEKGFEILIPTHIHEQSFRIFVPNLTVK